MRSAWALSWGFRIQQLSISDLLCPGLADTTNGRFKMNSIRLRGAITLLFFQLNVGAPHALAGPLAFRLFNLDRSSVKCSKPKVVVMGSSTANGVGASMASISWLGRLRGSADSFGFEVINRSRDGVGTDFVLANVDRILDETTPEFLIIATNIYNDGFVKDPAIAITSYISNVTSIIERARSRGTIPIVATMFPAVDYGVYQRSCIRRVNRLIEQLGVPVLDFASAVSDSDGRWLPGVNRDQIHPNDLGHGLMFSAIDPSLFVKMCESEALREYQRIVTVGPPVDGLGPNTLLRRIELSRVPQGRGFAFVTTFVAPKGRWNDVVTFEVADERDVFGVNIYLQSEGSYGILSVDGPIQCSIRAPLIDSQLTVGFSLDSISNRAMIFASGGTNCEFEIRQIGVPIQASFSLWPNEAGGVSPLRLLYYSVPALRPDAFVSSDDWVKLGGLQGWWQFSARGAASSNLWFGSPGIKFYE
jgi:hypothetical protein